jgi:hypothetical protein
MNFATKTKHAMWTNPAIYCHLVLQLARVLLQLQHYGACIAVTKRALADAAAAGDDVWAVQLLQLQANALAAEEDAAAALTCLREGMSR